MSSAARYVDLFVEESRDLLDRMGEDLTALEREPADRRRVDALFRGSHSIKGMAASLALENVSSLAHSLESLFARIRSGEEALDAESARRVLHGIDGLRDAIDEVAGNGHAEIAIEPAAPPPAPAPVAWSTFEVRFRVDGEPDDAPGRALAALARASTAGALVEARASESALGGGSGAEEIVLVVASRSGEDSVRSALLGPGVLDAEVVPVAMEPEEETVPPAGAREEVAAQGPVRVSGRGTATLRVPVEEIDRLLDGLGELILQHSRLERLADRLRRESGTGAAHPFRAELDRLRRQVTGLHHRVLSVRMLPFEAILPPAARAVRSLAERLGKRARLEVRGAEATLDRAVLEALVDPLQHVLRNALDHGIEPPEERAAAGKDPVGTVRIEVERGSDSLRIAVRDDGRGIHPERVLRHAVEKGFLTLEAARRLTGEDALRVVTLPGFSTAARPTEVSGHGVGMDAVRHRVESLGGSLRMTSEPGRGTTIEMQVPLTLAVLDALLVEANGDVYAVPVRKVRRTLELRAGSVRRRGGLEEVEDESAPIELLPLEGALEFGESEVGGRDGVALVFERGGRTLGLVVDAVLERREMVVKPLGAPLDRMREYSGATMLGDGRIALILDLENLV